MALAWGLGTDIARTHAGTCAWVMSFFCGGPSPAETALIAVSEEIRGVVGPFLEGLAPDDYLGDSLKAMGDRRAAAMMPLLRGAR